MALFNRKKKTDSVGMPPELQDYYQAENREKTWMAWVLGLATLVVTILLALALFFGGRWVYRKVRNEPAKTATTQTENKADQASQDTNSATDTDSSNNDAAATPPSNPTPAPSPASTTGTSSTSTSTPNSAGKAGSTDLPNTGPSDTLAIFAAVTVLAYAAHRRVLNN